MAFEWLNHALRERYRSLAALKFEPRLDNLRTDRRFCRPHAPRRPHPLSIALGLWGLPNAPQSGSTGGPAYRENARPGGFTAHSEVRLVATRCAVNSRT
jgi:hypothetical protein